MTANADILYLPILTPARIEVGHHQLTRENPQQQSWRQRIFRAPPQIKPVEGIAYGPDGGLTREHLKGKIIDTFA